MTRKSSAPPIRDFPIPHSKKQRQIAPVNFQDRLKNIQARNQKKENKAK